MRAPHLRLRRGVRLGLIPSFSFVFPRSAQCDVRNSRGRVDGPRRWPWAQGREGQERHPEVQRVGPRLRRGQRRGEGPPVQAGLAPPAPVCLGWSFGDSWARGGPEIHPHVRASRSVCLPDSRREPGANTRTPPNAWPRGLVISPTPASRGRPVPAPPPQRHSSSRRVGASVGGAPCPATPGPPPHPLAFSRFSCSIRRGPVRPGAGFLGALWLSFALRPPAQGPEAILALLTQSLLTGTYSRRGRCTGQSPPSTAIAPRPRATAAAPWPAGPADHSPASEIQLPPAPPLDRAAGHRPSAGRRGRVRHSRTFARFQSITPPRCRGNDPTRSTRRHPRR